MDACARPPIAPRSVNGREKICKRNRTLLFYPFAIFPPASACLGASFKPATKSRAGARLGCDAV